MESKTSVFRDEFLPYIIKWGRGLNLFGVVLCFGPCLALAIQGIVPPWAGLAAGLVVQLPSVASAYFYEPISYFAVLGIPGSYMAFLSGNIANMRVPCSAIAQEAAGVAEGSDEGTIIATIGIAVSIIVNLVILTAGVLAGAYVFELLPQIVKDGLNLMLPALFASMLASNIVKLPKLALVSVPLSFCMTMLKKTNVLAAFLPSWAVMPIVILTSVFGTMGLGLVMVNKGIIKA